MTPLEGADEALPFRNDDPWTYPVGNKGLEGTAEQEWESRSSVLIGISPEMNSRFQEGYQDDHYFKPLYVDSVMKPDNLLTPLRFQKGGNGLLYFIDADWKARLCVPKLMVPFILSLCPEGAGTEG
ncbi:hypothetical protein C8R42DRAFT_574087 [Lentinula raphanica]|nr:hypothetical protein C8R42DRAFT_574087 [Lentinula raphanica]